MSKPIKGRRSFAALGLVVCVLQAHVWAVAPDGDSNSTLAGKKVVYGRLAVVGDKTITLNGNGVRSGATVMSGAQIETPATVGASLQLWPLGRLEIAPRTALQLNFVGDSVDVNLLAGCVVLTTYAGAKGAVKTPQGGVERIGPAAQDFVDVCTGAPGAPSPVVGQGAAMKSGAGIYRPANAQPSGFNPMFLVGAAPFTFAGWYAANCTGRPPVASPCGVCCCCC